MLGLGTVVVAQLSGGSWPVCPLGQRVGLGGQPDCGPQAPGRDTEAHWPASRWLSHKLPGTAQTLPGEASLILWHHVKETQGALLGLLGNLRGGRAKADTAEAASCFCSRGAFGL